MMSLSRFTACVFLLFFSRLGASTYEQLPSPLWGGYDSDGTVVRWADDFVFSDSTLIRSVTWWGAENWPGNPSSGHFSARLFADKANNPGDVVTEFALGHVVGGPTGWESAGVSQFRYVGTLEEPFFAEAGTRYWLSIANPPKNTWVWQTSDSDLNPGLRLSFEGGEWRTFEPANNAAFVLSPDIPEPGSMVLLLGGCAWVCWVIGRRANRTGVH